MKQYPYLSLSLLLACVLLPPFLLRIAYPSLEPYPAVLLPAGAGTIAIGRGEVRFARVALWGRKDGDDLHWAMIDAEDFLRPLPAHFLNAVAGNSFGLNPAKNKLRPLPTRLNSALESEVAGILNGYLGEKVTPAEVQSGKRWLGQKLSRFGYVSTEMRITLDELTFDIESREITAVENLHEDILRLD